MSIKERAIRAAARAALSLCILLSAVLGAPGPAPAAQAQSAEGGRTSQGAGTAGKGAAVDTKGALLGLQNAFREVARKVLPVVVEIDVVDVVKRQVPASESPFEYFFGPQEGTTPEEREFRAFGLGSGVIVRKTGSTVYVLTNNHVAGDAEEITVKLHNRKQYKASLVGKDPRKDLALVSFETSDPVPVAELGDSDTVQAGDIVFAVGNPLGFESTITQGIVSAVGRRPGLETGVSGFTEYIQTDAAINQGNSGGALVDIDGKVIGVNTWIASPSGGSVGLGFTIPINSAKQAVDDFIAKGKVEYGWLGVNMGELVPDARDELKLGDAPGGFIHNVYKGSPADKGGILPGDYITSVNGIAIDDTGRLVLVVSALPLGKEAQFEIIRGGKAAKARVNIAPRKEDSELERESESLWPGMFAIPLTAELQKQLGLARKPGNVIVAQVFPNSPAAVAGLRPGDVVTAIGGKKVESLLDFYRGLNSGREVMFRIDREGKELIVGLLK